MTFVAALVTLVVTILFMLALRPVALGIGMVDRPGGRKAHQGEIPIIGGLAMFIGAIVGILVLPQMAESVYFLLLAAGLLVVIGLIDDRYALPATLRLVAQLVAILILVYGGGIEMHDIGNPLFIGRISLGPFSLLVTALIFTTVINAYNFVDGIDGLAGSLAVIALIGVAATAPLGSDVISITAILGAAILGYLLFNFPVGKDRPYRTFMGDAGSTFIGLTIVWLTVSICQGPTRTISPVAGLWFAALPLFDLITCIVRRTLLGKSPFEPGLDHFHHTLHQAGMSERRVVGTLALLQLVYVVFGIVTHYYAVPEPLVFTAWVITGATQFLVVRACATIYQRLLRTARTTA